MARTIRRKKHKYNYSHVLSTSVRIEMRLFYRYIRVPLDRHSKEGKQALAKYHSDTGFGDYRHATPPQSYRRMMNKTFVRKEKTDLAKWKKNPDYEIPSSVRVRNASWYW